MLDVNLKRDIMQTVHAAMQSALEDCDEVWLTGKQLSAQFGMFTTDWLRRYGSSLGRTRAEVVDTDGVRHCSAWVYPRNRIQRMIKDNRIKHLKTID